VEANEIKQALEMPFPVSRLHWRVGATLPDKSKGIALAYLNARDVKRRLDQVMGFDWQCRYPMSDAGLLICEIGLRINGEWIWRANGAGDTQVEAEKGKASDAFKRAGVMWGIGQYLYSLENMWVPIKPHGRSHVISGPPELPTWATPEGYKSLIEERAAA
jgi:hypothetical protein